MPIRPIGDIAEIGDCALKYTTIIYVRVCHRCTRQVKQKRCLFKYKNVFNQVPRTDASVAMVVQPGIRPSKPFELLQQGVR